jgi:Tfp pilus assembly protein PilP
MKAIRTIATMILAAGLASGQAPAKKPSAPASQSTTASKPAAKPATSTAQKPATTAATPKPATQAASTSGKGKRDPFVSPVIQRIGSATSPCATGKRCLVIDQLTLEGVVKTVNGWIAVVGNPGKKVYYLRINDALFDGYVERIDGNSIVFKQNATDAMGRQSQREVVKRITPSA